jgi:hypothetical protein
MHALAFVWPHVCGSCLDSWFGGVDLAQLSATVLQWCVSGPAAKRAMECSRLRKPQTQGHFRKLQIAALEIAHGECLSQIF